MSDPLDAELDRLFQLSPQEMVEARNALAARLRKAGDRPAAAHVKSLKRPTPAAWALNQLHFTQPALLDRALACAGQVRAMHARDGVEPRQLAAAVAAQRAATDELVEAALRRCEAAGLPGGPLQRRKLLGTAQGWLAGAGEAAPGRMTQDIEPAGFAAIAEVGAPLGRAPLAEVAIRASERAGLAAIAEVGAPAARAAAVAPSASASAAERAAREAAREALARHERSARAACERLGQRTAERRRAEGDLERAREEVLAAERALAGLRARVAEREAVLADATTAVDEARRAQELADQALASLRR